ncbi:MAG: SDR family oxidoreductase, partial [Acidimicrobiia bacterium]|nr:SDR family oxidoreductase [Acidimicrobiia bacterium]
MLRHLTEVLPVMITPRWVRTRCQPIAIRDVLDILVSAVEEPGDESHLWEIGGPDQLTYEDMMRGYAEVAGLPRRIIIPVPVLSPWLSKHWIGLVTPLPTGVAKPLVASLKNEVIVTDNTIAETFTGRLTDYRESVRRALRTSAISGVATRWSDAAASPAEPLPTDPEWAGATLKFDERTVTTGATPPAVFWAFSRIGGEVGYYSSDWAWELRGMVDSLIGGVGLRRGRRHPEDLRLGEAVDFWRVSSIEPGHRLQLHAEMKLPGEAWLEFEVEAIPTGSRLRQKASFYPRGLLGRLYWLSLTPFHRAIFEQMARGIIEAAEVRAGESEGE